MGSTFDKTSRPHSINFVFIHAQVMNGGRNCDFGEDSDLTWIDGNVSPVSDRRRDRQPGSLTDMILVIATIGLCHVLTLFMDQIPTHEGTKFTPSCCSASGHYITYRGTRVL
ncbi:hypothetical protein BJ170DRAFT_731192 [Xylariales sp. AK1849]|nr:hypothetical protein BJ170DRAFT_731192 [Xylariales sp. AK1849]